MERQVEQTCQAGDAVARRLQAGQPRAVLQLQVLQPKKVFKAEVQSYVPASSSCNAIALALGHPLCQGHPCVRLNLPCKQKGAVAYRACNSGLGSLGPCPFEGIMEDTSRCPEAGQSEVVIQRQSSPCAQRWSVTETVTGDHADKHSYIVVEGSAIITAGGCEHGRISGVNGMVGDTPAPNSCEDLQTHTVVVTVGLAESCPSIMLTAKVQEACTTLPTAHLLAG